MKLLARLLALSPFLFVACQTTVNGHAVESSKLSEYPAPSPFVAEQLDRQIADVPFLRGRQVVDACAEVARIGLPAVPRLLEATEDPEASRRVFAINVLSTIGDRRVLEQFRARLTDTDAAVRYEAARGCVQLGDWSGMNTLIDGLGDPSAYARTLCHEVLHRQTTLDFGYSPRGEEGDRAAAAKKWREWWARHQQATIDLRS